jgi:hypothetical protein
MIPAIPAIPIASSAPAIIRPERVPKCIWCDSREHSRRSDCVLFAEALKSENIKINENGRIAFASSGAEVPPAFGRGGMKAMYDLVFSTLAASQAGVHTITFDDGHGMDGDTQGVSVSTKEKGEWIEVDVEEKRKRDDGKFQRNPRRKIDGACQWTSVCGIGTGGFSDSSVAS